MRQEVLVKFGASQCEQQFITRFEIHITSLNPTKVLQRFRAAAFRHNVSLNETPLGGFLFNKFFGATAAGSRNDIEAFTACIGDLAKELSMDVGGFNS